MTNQSFRLRGLPNLQNGQNLPAQVPTGVWEAELFVLGQREEDLLRQHVALAQSRSIPQAELNLVQSLSHLALDPLPRNCSSAVCPIATITIDSVGMHIADCRDLSARMATGYDQNGTGFAGEGATNPGGGGPSGNGGTGPNPTG